MFNWFGGKAKEPAAPPDAGGLQKLKTALSMTGKALFAPLQDLVPHGDLDEEHLDELETLLIRADVGLPTAVAMTDKVRAQRHRLHSPEDLLNFLRGEFTAILSPFEAANRLTYRPGKLNIYLVVGVNGAGKTTFIGKLAHRFVQAGKKVVIGAGDTFRAAAEDQLAIWAQRAGADIVRPEPGGKGEGDPAAVIFDALQRAKATGADVVLLDTAGRLQNKFNLMEELRKIRKVIDKERPADSVLESLLVLDATTGQNALKQAEVFKQCVDLSGVVLTKLDSSAKGGIVLTVAKEHGLPVKLIGIGEGIEDLKDFDAAEFIDALFASTQAFTK